MIRRSFIAFAATLLVTASAFAGSGALSLVPNDAVTVGVVRLADMRTSPLSSMLFQHTDKVSANGDAAVFLQEAGLQPGKDVDLLVVATSPRETLGRDADILVVAEGRFNPARLTAALIARGAEKKGNYLILPEKDDEGDGRRGAVAFPDGSLAIAGTEAAVKEALSNRASGGTSFMTASGLGRDLARIDTNKATAWAVIDVARASRLTNAPRVPSSNQNAAALTSALKNISTVALWATDAGDALKLGGIGISRDEETLQLLEDTIKGFLAAMRLAASEKAPELVTVLRKFDVSHTADTVQITGSIPAETIRTFAAKQMKEKAAEVR